MSYEHELSKYERDENRTDLPGLLEMGKVYQAEANWEPKQPAKNSGVPVKRDPPAEGEEKPARPARPVRPTAQAEAPQAEASDQATESQPEAPAETPAETTETTKEDATE